MIRSRLTWWMAAAAVLLGALVAASCRGTRGDGPSKADLADVLYLNGTIVTMDDAGTTAQCVATKGPSIICVESEGGDSCCSRFRGTETRVVDLQGATVLPGFIDSHSHMAGWGLLNDPDHWTDISSVNVNLKPPPGDPRCKQADDYQRCFIPVKNQDEVVERLQRAAKGPSSAPILGFNYDPSRLGHSRGCKGTGVAFACTNFEDGTARAQLDKISTTRPILIGSESGHITYVNGKQLDALDICPPGVKPSGDGGVACHAPIENAAVEEKLARLGQLDEDLSFYATDRAIGGTLGKDPLQGLKAAIKKSAAVYAQNGFTSIQEGAAAPGLAFAYAEVSLDEETFPVTARILLYDDATNDLQAILKPAEALRKLQNPSFQIAGLKAFADGSTQGFTGYLGAPYAHTWAPFNMRSIFQTQPYAGLPDVGKERFEADFQAAHAAGFPLMVHQNGDAAIANVVAALPQPAASGAPPRDMMVHFSMATPRDLQAVAARGAGVTFLTPDLYYYGQPLCHQVLGPQRTAQLYPAGDAVKAGVRFGLHSDTPVTPPVPLFMIWAARTRKTQQMPWYEKDPFCPEVMGESQSISILQGLRAFTIDAAWLYGEESALGSIEVGKTADMVELSTNPLSMENDPDGLKIIRVLGTIHRGRFFPNPDAALPPIWPG